MISIDDAMLWEIAGSWFAPLCYWKWTQELAASYFAWKVKRKFRRYRNVVPLDRACATDWKIEHETPRERMMRILSEK